MTKQKNIYQRLLFTCLLRSMLTASLLVAGSTQVLAQEDEDDEDRDKKKKRGKGKTLPIKRSSPYLDRKSLRIPGKMPAIKPVKPKARPKLEEVKKRAEERRKKRQKALPKAKSDSNGSSTGGYKNLVKAGGKKCRPMRPNAKVSFDFKGDIKELVQTISKTTCKNFILTNKVRSQKFEIVSPTPITVEQAWRAFLSALEANDFTLVQTGRYYKIIQATDGTRSPVPMYDLGTDHPVYDRMVTKIFHLKYSSDVNAAVNYLNIFKSGKGQIHPFSATGTIIATDFGTSMARLERILKEIDQPGALEQVHIVNVEFATAAEIAEKLTQVFEPQKAAPGRKTATKSRLKISKRSKKTTSKKTDESSTLQVSKILADDRTNKLIIIASDNAFKQIMALKRELDIPDAEDGSLIHVIALKHADAEELASTLSSLASGKPTTTRRRTTTRKGKTKAKTPKRVGAATLFEGEVKVTADKSTNRLVITASKSDLASVKRVIEKLDVARLQVFVEAVILEVSIKRNRTLGAGWHGGVAPIVDGQETPIIFGNTPNQELSSLITAANPLGLASLLGFAGAVSGPTLSGTEDIVQGGIPAIGVVLQALQSTNDVNVVSTPHLLTMDNEEAEIQVNEKRPFPSGLSLGGLSGLAGAAGAGGALGALGNVGGLGLGSVSFNREDIGLTLKLKPQINDEDFVKLEIDQELSDVAGTDQVTGQTITSKRSIKNVVTVRSQDSIVIGGLVRDRETIDEAKTPLLGDLPLLGWLFKRQQKTVEKVNLLLVLTPFIIRTPNDFRKIFERKMDERKEFMERFYGMSEDYRAAIDWNRKVGPLASYRRSMRKEMKKIENEGPGETGEQLVTPESVTLESEEATLPEVDADGPAPEEGTPITPDIQPTLDKSDL